MGLFFRFYSEKQKGAERPVYHADKGEGGASGIIEEGRDMAFKIILFSNQRDPIEEWRAGSRLEALELVARTALPEAIARERAALWFVGEVVAIRIEPEGHEVAGAELSATTERNVGNGAHQARRAKTSTERSQEFRRRQREKAEEAARQASLQGVERKKAEQQETCDAVAGDVTSAGNDVAKVVAPVPAPLVERPAWRIVAPAERPRRDILTLMTALALATVSAGFSIVGMTAVFVGAFWPVVAMGVALEAGKLRAVALLGMGRGSRRLRSGLVVLVAVLMTLNAVGCFGYLSRAHIGHEVETDNAVTAHLADIDGRIAVQAAALADIDRRLGQIDGAIEKGISAGKINGAMALAGSERNARTNLQVERMAAGKVLAELKTERARIEGQGRMVAAELGPVRYLAALVGAEDEVVLRYFILIVALLLDPAAVLLLLAAASTRRPNT